jgi:2-amino-4-hydroxy-6-hydroxymethyldihydropteridine diphosphokinase
VTRVFISTFLALGSNAADRESYLRKGLQGLRDHEIEVVRCASVYETEPKDVGDQPWFLNTVVEAQTVLSPHELLSTCLMIEKQNQRVRTTVPTARTLDIDILFYGDQVVRESDLTIPHPRFAERRFVLVPLAEIAPDFMDPITQESFSTLLRKTGDTSLVRITPITL